MSLAPISVPTGKVSAGVAAISLNAFSGIRVVPRPVNNVFYISGRAKGRRREEEKKKEGEKDK